MPRPLASLPASTFACALVATLALGVAPQSATPPAAPATPPTTPLSAPQVLPRAIVRHDPKMYDIKYEVVIAAFPNTDQAALQIAGLAFVLPIVFDSPSSRIDPQSMRTEMWFDSRQDKQLSERAKIEGNKHLGQSWAVLPIGRFQGSTIRWNVSFRAQAWSTAVDDAVLNKATWPREWPKEVADALKPQLGIESDSAIVQAAVRKAVGENPRLLPPYAVAKEVIRTILVGFRGVQSDAMERRGIGRVVGMRLVGAAEAMTNEQGSTHDVVCACVAALRAAGIPARAVVGIGEVRRSNGINRSTKTTFVSWGEFFLSEVGWVSFDPDELRGKAVRQLKLDEAWPGIGTLDDLNERIVLSYSFMPEGLAPPAFPAGWSFFGNVGVLSNSLETYISLQMISRGKGVDDPVK